VTPPLSSSLREAVLYQEHGLSLLPLSPGIKTPHIRPLEQMYGAPPGWKRFQEQAPSKTEIERWYQLDPDTGIGIVTGLVSGLAVADYDSGPIPELATPTVQTRRGAHLYFGTDEATRTRRFPQGDLKADGGYVLAPSTRLNDGTRYQWLPSQSVDELPLLPLDAIAMLFGPQTHVQPAPLVGEFEPALTDLPPILLSDDLHRYLALPLTKAQRGEEGIDGSAMEMRLIHRLLASGYSIEQVFAFFERYMPNRYREERARGTHIAWLSRSIQRAEQFRFSHSTDQCDPEDCTNPSEDENGAIPRSYQTIDPWLMLKRVHGQRVGEWIAETITAENCSKRAAKYKRKQLEQAGYIYLQALDGRTKTVHLTKKALRKLDRNETRFRGCVLLPKHPNLKERKKHDRQ
jgi:bifunctional DNA primase/polymerase-like protein